MGKSTEKQKWKWNQFGKLPLYFILLYPGKRNTEYEVDERILREDAWGIQRRNGTNIHCELEHDNTADHEDGGTIFKIRKPRKDKNDKQPCGITARRDKCPSGNESVENMKVIVNTKNTKKESVTKTKNQNTLENGKIKSQT